MLNGFLVKMDPVRAIQMKTMVKSFMDNPIWGNGLGSYYSEFFQNKAWALQSGGYGGVDVPGNFYLMILAAIGLAGILVLMLGAGVCTRMIYEAVKPSRGPKASLDESAINAFALGVFCSLGVSFLIGTHIFFLSVSYVFGLALAWGIHLFFRSQKHRASDKLFIWGVFGVCGLLSLGILSNLTSIPRPPSFAWEARNQPQVPVGLAVPIVPPGKGSWVKDDTGLLLSSGDIEIFVEKPPQYYPQTVSVEIFGLDGKPLMKLSQTIEKYLMPKPGKTLKFSLSEEIQSTCLRAISPQSFCSYKVSTHPKWQWLGEDVAVFIEERFTKL